MSTRKPTPLILAILDGWGYREETEHNAIAAARTPNWDRLWQQHAHAVLDTSGLAVGLPEGQMGNSEVGHLNIGSGRVVYQDFTRITQSIQTGDFFDNDVLLQSVADSSTKVVHIIGLLSPGGVHSHEDHLAAAVDLAHQQGCQIVLHAFLDGRDMPPRSAQASIDKMQAKLDAVGGRFATVCGRYYAMDRDQRWERVEVAYQTMVATSDSSSAQQAASASEALAAAYARDENDEFVLPTVIGDPVGIQAGDTVWFMNYRADRARQLTAAFVEPDFDGFARDLLPVQFVALTEYKAGMNCPSAYPPVRLPNVLGQVLADAELTQLRIAETEKYAHVTFFFNGGVEQPFAGETRELIPSPAVATYDLQPEMSAAEVTDKIVEAIQQQSYDVIMVNFANPDMVGHTGVFDAAVTAVETIDTCVGRIADALKPVGGEMLVTADHGNVELMHNSDTGQAHTAHTTFTVPLLYIGRQAQVSNGALCDLAPTMLSLLGIDIPADMTGQPLVAPTAEADAA